MQAGNYYWVLLDRPKAASYYQRVLDVTPTSLHQRTPLLVGSWEEMNLPMETVT